MTATRHRPRAGDRVPFIGGPLDGQLAESFRPIYRSAETGKRLSTSVGDHASRLVSVVNGGKLLKRTREKVARVYLRDEVRGGYVWLPIACGLDMDAPWVTYLGGRLAGGRWWAAGSARFRRDGTGEPVDDPVALDLISKVLAGIAEPIERSAVCELYLLMPQGYEPLAVGPGLLREPLLLKALVA